MENQTSPSMGGATTIIALLLQIYILYLLFGNWNFFKQQMEEENTVLEIATLYLRKKVFDSILTPLYIKEIPLHHFIVT